MKLRHSLLLLNVTILTGVGIGCDGLEPGEPAPLSRFNGALTLSWSDLASKASPSPDGAVRITVSLEQPGFPDCLQIRDDVSVTIGGVRLGATEKGSRIGGAHAQCLAPTFQGTLPPEMLTGGDATLLVSDGATTKSMDLPHLLSRPEVAPQQPLTSARRGDRLAFVWSEGTRWRTDVPEVPGAIGVVAFLFTAASDLPTAIAVNTADHGSTLTVPASTAPGPKVLRLSGYPHLAVSQCAGAPECRTFAHVEREWPVVIE